MPTTAWTELPAGVVFRPLVEPVPIFPWSPAWLAGAEGRPEVAALLECARALRDEQGWV